MAQPSSISRFGTYEPFDLQVSRGQIAFHTPIFRAAYSTYVTSGQNYALWNRAANYTFPTVASTMTLSSSATGDTTQSVLIQGLDASYNPISEVVALNGQTGVTSTKSYLRINDMIVITDSPTGNIYFGTGSITAGVPANVYGFISAGDNKALSAIYTVPAGYTLYITGGSLGVNTANATKYVTVSFKLSTNGVTFVGAPIIGGSGFQYFPYTPPLAVQEKTDLFDTATTTDNTTSSATANLQGILIKNNSQTP